jgi:hypothetical protein
MPASSKRHCPSSDARRRSLIKEMAGFTAQALRSRVIPARSDDQRAMFGIANPIAKVGRTIPLGEPPSLLTSRKFPAPPHREFAAVARRARQIFGLIRRVGARTADLSL